MVWHEPHPGTTKARGIPIRPSRVGGALGKCPEVLNHKHPQSCWITGLLDALTENTADEDVAVGQWLFERAPAGFALAVPAGPYFSAASDPEGSFIEDALAATKIHPALDACYGEKPPPGCSKQ